MKLYFLIFAVVFCSSLLAQDFKKGMQSPTANFYEIQQAANDYYSIALDTGEASGFADFKRWEWFWQNRVDAVNSNKSGSFQYAQQALNTLLQNPVCVGSSSVPSNWQLLGPTTQMTSTSSWPNIGIIVSMVVNPLNPNTVFVGSNSGGLWKTTNFMSSSPAWKNATDNLRLPGLGINDIVIDPSDTNVVYAATGYSAGNKGGGYGVGVLKSTNGGNNWTQIGPGTPSERKRTKRLLIHPTNTDTIYALVNDSVFRTYNGGNIWYAVFGLPYSIGDNRFDSGSPARFLRDIEMKPSDPNTIYVSSDDALIAILDNKNNGSLIYKTTNGGNTWTEVTIETNGTLSPFLTIAVTPAEPNSIFAIYKKNNSTFLKKSTNEGNSWNTVSNPSIFGFGNYLNDMVVSSTDAQIVYIAGYWANKSLNGGSTFTQQSSSQHIDLRRLIILGGSTVSNGANDTLIQGNDGGVSYTVQGGSPWVNKNGTGLAITQYYAFGDAGKSNLLAGGTQDNDVSVYNNGNWTLPALSQDGAEVVIDRNDPNIMYVQKWCCSFSSKQIYKYFFNGSSWVNQGNFQPSNIANNVRPMLQHKNGYLYVGYEDVYKSPTPNILWTKISNFSANFSSVIDSTKLVALDVAPSDPNVIYAAYSGPCWTCTNPQGYLFKTTDGGTSWTDVTDNTSSSASRYAKITDIVIHPEKPNKVWITFSGFWEWPQGSGIARNRVNVTNDGGSTWQDYSDSLTQFPVNTIVYEKGSNDGLYVGTDVGIFYRNASMNQWECFSDNFPVAIVTDLEINYASNKIRAATFGRGIWESHLACPTDYDLTFTGTQTSGFYEVQNNITSNAVINAGSNVSYRAGNEIVLTDGFHAKSGSNFHAFIHACNHTGNSFKKQDEELSGEEEDNKDTQEEKPVSETILYDNYPNPFSDHTHIDYTVEKEGLVTLTITNICGYEVIKLVDKQNHATGNFTGVFESGNIPPGIYFYTLQIGNRAYTKKMVKTRE